MTLKDDIKEFRNVMNSPQLQIELPSNKLSKLFSEYAPTSESNVAFTKLKQGINLKQQAIEEVKLNA